jgi:hypothetical protein
MFSEDLDPEGGKLLHCWKGTRVLRDNGGTTENVWKGLCNEKAETVGDPEEAVRWWKHKFV